MGALSWIMLILLCGIGLIAGAAAVFVLTVPKDFVRDHVVAQVKRQTGRDLVIAGPASFHVYPSLGFSLGDVSLSAPEGMGPKPLVEMARLDVSVRLIPLLRREVVIDQLVLQKPVFELHVDRTGRRTWDMAGLGAPPRTIRLAQAAGTASDAPDGIQDLIERSAPAAAGGAQSPSTAPRSTSSGLAALEKIELGDVRIEDGIVRYSDARTSAKQEASGINVQLGLSAISLPLEAKGDLVWKSEKISFDATVDSLKSIIDEKPAKLNMTLVGRPVALTFNGSVSVKDTMDVQGATTAKSASVKALAKWLGTELPPVPGFGPLDFKGQVRATDKSISVSDTNLNLDGATGSGQISIDTSGNRPYVKGNITLSMLDLNKYIGNEGETSQPAAGASNAPPAAGPQVKGFQQRSGWSEGQIDASALGLADADVKLNAGGLLFKKIKVGKSQLTIALKNLVLKTTFDDVQLYDGSGKGILTLDATQPKIVVLGTNMTIDGIAAQPLLKDAADMDWLAGTGKINLAVSGQGQSQRQIMETLTGKADLTFLNGALVGWNIPAMVRGVSQGRLSGLSQSNAEKTDFSEFTSTWSISNGLAQNDDLRLVSPLLRVAGAGSVMLPAREIDYTVRPTLVASLEGQGATGNANGLEIPVKVQGSWDKPKITPDIGSVLKNPDQAVEAVKQLGQQFKGKKADDIIKGILGDKNSSGEGAADGQPSDKDKAKQLLEGLFR